MKPSSTRPPETRTHRLLGDPSRARILQLLRDRARPLAAADVAAETGLHASTARFHLELLTDAGLVERATEVRTSRGRPRTLYATAAAPLAVAAGDASYQMLAEVLAERLSGPGGAASAATAGLSWGRRLQPSSATVTSVSDATQRLCEVFTEAGFEPAVTDKGDLILYRCPFVDAARRNPRVVCSVHRGMAQGVLQQLQAPLSAVALEPNPAASRCVLRLRPAPGV